MLDCSAPQAASPVSRAGTLSGYATARAPGVFVVGSAFDRDALGRAAQYSAAGPNAGRAHADLAAVSEESRTHPGVTAAATLSGGTTQFSGTSKAAPQLTRALVSALGANPGMALGDLPGVLARIGALPNAGPTDPQLGTGVLPFAVQQGRTARRFRP